MRACRQKRKTENVFFRLPKRAREQQVCMLRLRLTARLPHVLFARRPAPAACLRPCMLRKLVAVVLAFWPRAPRMRPAGRCRVCGRQSRCLPGTRTDDGCVLLVGSPKPMAEIGPAKRSPTEFLKAVSPRRAQQQQQRSRTCVPRRVGAGPRGTQGPHRRMRARAHAGR